MYKTLLAGLATLSLGLPFASGFAANVSSQNAERDAAGVAAASAAEAPPLAVDQSANPAAAEAKPVTFEVVFKADALKGLSGDWRGSASLFNLDAKMTMDMDKTLGVPGGTLFVYLLSDRGAKPNNHVGAAQGINNIEVGTNTSKLYQVWYQQNLFDDKLSVLAGLYDLNSEFYVTDAAGLFIHPAFGVGTELSQTGANGPSIFPTTSLGLRASYQFSPNVYGQVVVLDAVAGDPNHPRGTHVHFDRHDGALVVAETGYHFGAGGDGGQSNAPAGKYSLGVWTYTANVDDLSAVDVNGNPANQKNAGLYVMAERSLFRESADASRGLTGFVRFGVANADVNPVEQALTMGLVYQGPLRARIEDSLGLAFATARFGAKFRHAAVAVEDPASGSETTFELTYRAQVFEWLAVQPEFQYIVHGGEASLRNAFIGGIRFEVSL